MIAKHTTRRAPALTADGSGLPMPRRRTFATAIHGLRSLDADCAPASCLRWSATPALGTWAAPHGFRDHEEHGRTVVRIPLLALRAWMNPAGGGSRGSAEARGAFGFFAPGWESTIPSRDGEKATATRLLPSPADWASRRATSQPPHRTTPSEAAAETADHDRAAWSDPAGPPRLVHRERDRAARCIAIAVEVHQKPVGGNIE